MHLLYNMTRTRYGISFAKPDEQNVNLLQMKIICGRLYSLSIVPYVRKTEPFNLMRCTPSQIPH